MACLDGDEHGQFQEGEEPEQRSQNVGCLGRVRPVDANVREKGPKAAQLVPALGVDLLARYVQPGRLLHRALRSIVRSHARILRRQKLGDVAGEAALQDALHRLRTSSARVPKPSQMRRHRFGGNITFIQDKQSRPLWL